MESITSFLILKKDVKYLLVTNSIRQTLEKMEFNHYNAIPILSSNGDYIGVISDGDLLWFIKENELKLKELEDIKIEKVKRAREYKAIRINEKMEDLLPLILEQNFVPVIDDRNKFIGIITRKEVIKYSMDLKKR